MLTLVRVSVPVAKVKADFHYFVGDRQAVHFLES